MKSRSLAWKVSAIAFTMVLLVSLTTSVFAKDEKIVWKFQTILNPGYMIADGAIWLSEELEKKTNGNFKIQVFTGGALGFPTPRALMNVGQGLLDSSDIVGPYVSGDIMLAEIVSLHGLIPFNVPLRKAIMDEAVLPVLEKTLREKFKVQLFTAVQIEPRSIYTKKPVKQFADLKGQNLRSEGINENAFTKLIGATPLTMGFGEVYTSLERGLLDGTWSTHSGTYNAKVYEATKYVYELDLGGTPVYFGCNLDKFNQLPAEYQKLLMELGRQAGEMIWNRVGPDTISYKKNLLEKGCIFTPATAEDKKMISEGAPKIWEDWLQRAEPDAKEVMKNIRSMVDDWQKKQK
jgi:TRAP-type transport system periplasmic protein